MTKLFKNSKQILAFVFAFAVLAVSLFTGSINIDADACDVSKIDYWDGTKASSFAGGTGTKEDPYIIKTAEQLAYCCTGINAASSTGKFYKVDDSVKVFVMQPEGLLDLDTLLGLNDAQAVKDYLSAIAGKKDWSSLGASGFNGNFDGNGVTIYGLWADGITTNKGDVGLFPRYDGGYLDGDGNVVANVCKNVAVRNSYFSSTRRIGAITGASYGVSYDGCINGIIHYDTIAVVNCYITANASSINHYGEEAIIADGGADDVSTFNNCLVKGNYAYNYAVNLNIAPVLAAGKAAGNKASGGEIVKNKVSNSIILGSDPFRRDKYLNLTFQNHKEGDTTVYDFFDNVITDQPAGKVTAEATTVTFSEENVKQITATGFDFQAEATTLDWENTWFMSENGPELRAFHGTISLVTDYTTHVWKCSDCGLMSPGGVADHNFVCDTEIKGDGTDVYYCKDCGYTCQHNSQGGTAYEPGDCLTAPGVYTRCDYCPWYVATGLGDIPGHSFQYVDADPGHCAQDGHKAYWLCTVCNNKYAAEDADGNPITAEQIKTIPFESAVSDADLNTGLGGHIKSKDQFGYILGSTADGHWYTCEIDGGRINVNCIEIGEEGFVKHDYLDARCKECGWTCTNHDWKETGKTLVAGDCTHDEEKEIKCKICKYKSSKITKKAAHQIEKVDEVAATDKLEGTKAHYYCGICNTAFADAEAKTVVTTASLVIPKVLPDEYKDVPLVSESEKDLPVTSTPSTDNKTDDGEGEADDNDDASQDNVDDSETSPDTRDNVVSVMAVAALAGAAFVIARKARK